jgi:O-antigen ligase
MSLLLQITSFDKEKWFYTASFFIISCIVGAILVDNLHILLLPVCVIGLALFMDDYRPLYLLLLAVIPFSAEFYFEGVGLGTDLPSEPLMILLTGFVLFTWMRRKFSLPKYYITHIVMILLVMHILWFFVTVINSTYPINSIKVFLSKIWYILPFLIMPLMSYGKNGDIIQGYRVLFKFLLFSVCIVLIRHAFSGFTFASSYDVVRPFYRNHVAYASIIVVCLPFVWAFAKTKVLDGKKPTAMWFCFWLFVVAIYFSFTRAAILSMIFAFIAYYLVRMRWIKKSIFIAVSCAVLGIIYLSWNNTYMDFTPNYERTIAHTEFDNLVEATYKLEDISTMERVYRWIAGIEMIKDKFWMGFGPSTFYNNYQAYSISRFQTYVSYNPEKSGIHNYYLMTWVEQGLIGFVLFIALCVALLVEGEKVYHQCGDASDKYYAMAATLSLLIILSMCLINDLIETDKVGPFYFLNMAIILFYGYKNHLKSQNAANFTDK